ncbi:MAG: AMP-binding protein [Rhizobiaceae bacterium]
MTNHFDKMETRSHDEREGDLFTRLPNHLKTAVGVSPSLSKHLNEQDLGVVNCREALAKLPVLRKPELMAAQTKNPPFGGFVNLKALAGSRVFLSPGPIWEPQGAGADPWLGARALYAAGFRKGHMVHNALSYHMTPGGFILDEGLRELGCTVFPAGIGNTEMQVEAAVALQPVAYTGTPDYLKVILDKAEELGKDLSCIKRALVSGGALFPSMREEYTKRGVAVLQAYATADLGVIAYESSFKGGPTEGMIVNEDLIVEIVRPGTDDPVEDGEVGELVVTNFSMTYPLVRFGTGDLSAVLPGQSACGRTNMRIKGWMGRADQRTKVKGMFIDPKQIADLVKRHGEIEGARLIVARDGDQDVMRLLVKGMGIDTGAVSTSLRELTKLGGAVEVVKELPNDGKVISDERDYDA